MKLFIHPATKRYLDYGDLLETVIGIGWSCTGKAQDANHFEWGQTFESVSKRFDDLTVEQRAAVELCHGEPVGRTVDMNPHGLI